MKTHPWIDASYSGHTKLGATLYKNKWNIGIGILFGRYVKRFFVVDLVEQTFSYYSDPRCTSGCMYKFEVSVALAFL